MDDNELIVLVKIAGKLDAILHNIQDLLPMLLYLSEESFVKNAELYKEWIIAQYDATMNKYL